MEDASLDDFFAKKDKSKKKSKTKSAENDDGTKPTKKEKKKDKNTKLNSTNSSTNKSQERNKADDDEWNDFEEEKAVDYSGLRIQNLQQKEDVEKDAEGEEEELDENGELRDRKEGSSGPWNKANVAAVPIVKEEEKPAPAPITSGGKYIPPSQRAGAASAMTSTASSIPGSRRKKELPNIRSDLDFPTLAAGPGQSQTNSIPDNPNQRRAANLTLENKFSVLQD